MIDKDKFGRAIYPKVFSTLQKIGRQLEQLGYYESRKKPNLFYRPHKNAKFSVVFFADMRGTDVIPIWEAPRPMFYWNFEPKQHSYPIELRQRVVCMEWQRMSDVPKRLSTELRMDPSSTKYREAALLLNSTEGNEDHASQDGLTPHQAAAFMASKIAGF